MASFDSTAEPQVRPARARARPRLLWRWRLIGAASLAILLAHAVGAFHPDADLEPTALVAASPEAPAMPAKPTWTPITKPLRLYALDAPDILTGLTSYEARRHNSGGGRDDILTFGSVDGAHAFLQLSIFHAQQETLPVSSFFLDMARAAAEAGLAVDHSTVPAPLATRFGSFDVADVALGQASNPSNCLGFRFFVDSPNLRFRGVYCGTATHPADRGALRCLINRLDLVSAGDDSALRDWFVDAERRRSDGDCGAPHPGGHANNWLEVGAAKPILKTGKTAAKRSR